MTFKLEATTITLTAGGRCWQLHRPADLETLWENMTADEFTADERLPYWVEIWPASIALCDWLNHNAKLIKNKNCLDLGCGLGLTAMQASILEARVLAVDYEEEALHFAKKSAELNNISSPCFVVADWRYPAFKANGFDFIWGGDIMYERRFVEPVMNCIEHALAPQGKVWLAEPNRNVYAEFQAELKKRNWQSKKVYTALVDPLHVQKHKVNVNLWEITPAF